MKKKQFPEKHISFSCFFILALLLCARVWAEASEEVNFPDELMLIDFENNSLVNNLDGESGTWNLNLMDPDNSFCDADIVLLPTEENQSNRVLKLSYSLTSELPSQNGFWTKLMDFDAQYYDHIFMDVKGDSANGFTDRFKIEIKKFRDAERQDVIKGGFEIPVTDEWTTVRIPLNKLTGIIDFQDPESWKDASVARKHLDEFIILLNDRHVTRKTGVIYIDNLRFVRTENPGPSAIDFPPRTIKKTDVDLPPLDYAKFLINRLGGFPKQVYVKKDFPADDREFLLEVARDTWRFFDEMTDRENALPLDTIQLGESEPVDEKVWIGDYTNITNIGIYLMAIVSAYDLGFIDKADAVSRIRATLDTVEKMESHESGFLYNYYDTTVLEKTSYFVSFVDSSWLLAGFYVAKNAFPEEIASQAEPLINRGNLSFFYDPVERQMYHGFYSNLGVYADYHYGIFYSEPRAGSYMAIARGEVPEEHWFQGLVRTFPENYTWQTQRPLHRISKTVRGYSFEGGYYEYNGIPFVPSWGGSAFEAFMPPLVLDEKALAPEGLGLNNAHHALGQMRYALDELQYPVWGMSPSAVPEGGYSEFGAKAFGLKGYKPGVVTPHASILALDYIPEKVVKNLRELIKLYNIYGEYGFYDAVTVETGLVARKYLALDQGMILVAINNYLNSGAIRHRFQKDPVLTKAEPLLTSEKRFKLPEKQETLKDLITMPAE